MNCILAERLYVPEEYVTDRALREFTYFIDEDDREDYTGFEGYNETYRSAKSQMIVRRTINTFNKVQLEGKVYYGFSRGDLAKLFDLFGDYEWDSMMSDPPFKHPLVFSPDKRLLNYEDSGRGQAEAVGDWLDKSYGIIRAAPRFGKTISSIFIATALGKKTVIIAHQIELLRQFYKSVLEFTNVVDLWLQYGVVPPTFRLEDVLKAKSSPPTKKLKDAKNVVVGFFNDYHNPEELDICLLSWQKFASKFGPERIADYQNTWGTVIVDEVHRASSLKFAGVVNKLNAQYRLGLTGTVERKDGLEFIIKEIIGPVTANGRVRQVPCKVEVYQTGYKITSNVMEPICKVLQRFYSWEDRTQRIIEMLVKDAEKGYYICVSFHPSSNEQLLNFTDRLNFRLEGMKAEAFHGGARNREDLMDRARSGETRILVCNSQMLTGIDIPRWNMFYNIFPESNVVFNDEGGLSGNFYQKFSRIRTPFDYESGVKKDYGIIKDFLDDGTFARGTFKHRLDAYKHQGFSVDFFKWQKPKKETSNDE